MTDDVSKLPAWPKEPKGPITDGIWHEYDRRRYVAALARMQALVKTLRMVDPFCDELHHDAKDFHSGDEPCPVRARIDALLAACEREAGPGGEG